MTNPQAALIVGTFWAHQASKVGVEMDYKLLSEEALTWLNEKDIENENNIKKTS